jgi:DNA-binding MarR family transcriptional regulator
MEDRLKDIKLEEIINNWRVKQYVRRKTMRLTKINIDKLKNNQSQVLSCHSWLLLLHYEAINRLEKKYNLSKPEFMVLMGAYLFSRVGRQQFKAKELSNTLLYWQYNRIYRHLRNLSNKGFITIYKNRYSGLQRYSITSEGKRPIKSFSQHYRQVFDEVWKEIGDFPPSFDSIL